MNKVKFRRQVERSPCLRFVHWFSKREKVDGFV